MQMCWMFRCFLMRGEAYRPLPLKNLTEKPIRLILDLSAYFQQQNSLDQEKRNGAYQKISSVVCADDKKLAESFPERHFLRSCYYFCIRVVFLAIWRIVK